jgi:hypothetical protein
MTKNRVRRHLPTVALVVAALGMAASVSVLAGGPQLQSKPVSAPDAKQYIGGDNFVFSISIGSGDEWWLTHADDADVEEFPLGTPPPEGVEMEYVTTITVLKYPENSHCYWITVGGKPVKCCPEH